MNVLSSFKQVDTFVFDVDGVLTDGSVLVLENGEMARRMNIKDGYALQLAIKKGYRIFIVSGSSPSAVEQRLNYLGISEIYFRIKDKKEFVQNLAEQHAFDMSRVLFMGDDMPDLPVFDIVGLSCCPADAVSDLKSAAKYISIKNGGEGCVRDVIEKVLKVKGDWKDTASVASK
ncbi:KdsC family phosphatase [Niabella ginsengisoli]|uniref:HAD hydrolase family protein n=1 Tax=Niabella ginsengisoli TaxID=522298 RepID=A0ABS9SFM2_9BACT|nr:HAD hydrolase family protein [Niabella ginsengisoli]MCH5597159.1 HAD hydrolase family protein [Niabella ginsengisoli]